MNYEEVKDYIQSSAAFGSVYGLESIKELLERLNNPQNDLKFIHIAGTNGKGSTLAFLNSVLIEAKYNVGRYSSPALLDYREIIQFNSQYIEKEIMATLFTVVKKAIDQMLNEGLNHPTKFEMEAALAFLFFKEKKVDIVLLETGLGGLLDATNVVSTTLIAIISSISKDHIDILGNKIEEITYQKAGIIKENIIVVSFNQSQKIMQVIETTCKQKSSQLIIANTKDRVNHESDDQKQVFDYLDYTGYNHRKLEIKMLGSHQLDNVLLAIETINQLRILGYNINQEQLRNGLKKADWFGRLTILNQKPLWIIDGAHNEGAAIRMKETLEINFKNKRKIFMFGMFKDKDYLSVIKLIAEISDCIITIDMPNNERLLRAETLKKYIEPYQSNVVAATSIDDACFKAMEMANNEDLIIALGSLSFLGEIKKNVERWL